MEFRSTNQRQHAQPNGSASASKETSTSNLFIAVIDVMINLPVMYSVWLERRVLKKLSYEQLEDIGVHPYHAKIECSRWFYDIPFARRKRAKELGSQFKKLTRTTEKRRF